MATSLVSTGVQFPDSTIQTTAATSTPSMAAAGSTIYTLSNAGTWAYGSNSGNFYGSTNISTTAPSLLWERPELSNGMWYSPGSSQAAVSNSSESWAASGNTSTKARIQYDFYSNRFQALLYLTSGAQTAYLNVYSTDCINWTPFANTASYGNTSVLRNAYNNYTGAQVSVYSGSEIRTYTAAQAYNDNGTYTGYYPPGSEVPDNPSFIDTGTQSTSKFFAVGANAGASTCVVFSRAANNDAGSFSEYSLGNYNASSRVIGMSAEIMFYNNNGGVFYSTNMGGSWNRYNFIDNAGGSTAPGATWRQMAWNGSYWLGIPNFNTILVTKAMGSGTTWSVLSTFTASGVSGVAWNPTLSLWIIAAAGSLYTNSSSNPNSGSWTLVRTLPGWWKSSSNLFSPFYIKAASTFNF